MGNAAEVPAGKPYLFNATRTAPSKPSEYSKGYEELVGGLDTKIMHGRLEMELKLIPPSSLHLHERTIPGMVRALVGKLRRDGAVRDPVMADSASHVVLDGMHRVTALVEMGCRRIPACLLPYSDPSVSVKCWYRMLDGRGVQTFLRALPRRSAWAADEAEVGAHAVRILYSGGSLSLSCRGVEEAYSVLEEVEDIASRSGLEIRYEVEEEAGARLRSNAIPAIIVPPAVTKEDVVGLAIQGRLLPPKSTRHVFPARPVELNLPLRILREPSDSEARAEFEKLLAGRVVKPVTSGASYGRRRYHEELYVLS